MGREMAINWIYHNSIGKLAINLMKCAVNVTQIKPDSRLYSRDIGEGGNCGVLPDCLRLSRRHRIIKHLNEARWH